MGTPRSLPVDDGLREVGLDGVISSLREHSERAANEYERIREQSENADLLQITDRQRALAVLRASAKARDEAAYWARVLLEFAAQAGVTQRESASALGISTQTVNRWLKEPVRVDGVGAEAPTSAGSPSPE